MSTASPGKPKLIVAANLSWQRSVIAGETVYVCNNDLSGEHFATDHNTYRILTSLSDGIPLPDILADQSVDRKAFAGVLPSLMKAGLIRGEGDAGRLVSGPGEGKKPKPIESRFLFGRFEFVEVGCIYPMVRPIVSLLFSRFGVVAFGIILVAALNALIANRTAFYANMSGVDVASPAVAVTLVVIFLVLKALHEMGHALATAHFLQTEKKPVPLIRAGIALFFIFPFPFTNTSASWQLSSKWRRAAIGAAGIYVEMWIAIVAALLWAQIGESDLQVVLFQIMLVAGVSTLVFNLNPLIRLDGYYILTDVMDMPNLATRSGQVARAAGLRALGVDTGATKPRYSLLVYWGLSLAYRCFMFAAIFFIAMATDPSLAAGVAIVAVLVLIARPALSTYRAALQAAQNKFLRIHVRALGVALVAGAVLFVPVDDALILDGRVEFGDLQHVYSEVPGRLSIRPTGLVDGISKTLVTVDNPELEYKEVVARKGYALAEINYRKAFAKGPEELASLQQELLASRKEIEEIARQKSQRNIHTHINGFWIPAESGAFEAAWSEPGHQRAIGVVVPNKNPGLTAELDQETADVALQNLVGRIALVRFPGRLEDFIKAEVVSVARVARGLAPEHPEVGASDPRAQSVFEVKLQPVDRALPKAVQLEGKRFVARISGPTRPLWQVGWTRVERLAQKRFRLQSIE